MSEERRPRRSAAASNKAWATLMPKGGEEEFAEETPQDVPKAGMKRSASKEQAPTPSGRGRKKKPKNESESGEAESTADHNTSHEQLNSSANEAKSEASKPSPRSPKKLLPKITKVTPATLPQATDNVEMMHQAFDQHQADLAEKLEEGDMGGEEEEMVPVEHKTAKIPAKGRGRPSKNSQPPLPPALTGMDDPNDEDYNPMGSPDEARPPPKKRATQPRPRQAVIQPPMSPQMRQPVYHRPPAPPVRATTLVVRQPMPQTRVVYPARFPTIVNGGPRVVQPRYISQNNAPRNLNPAALRQPVNNNAYDTPVNVLREIEKLTEDCKKVSSPEVVSAFQLVEILREEMERMQQHIRESNHYYRGFIEDLQAAAHSQFESSQNRCISLEQRVTALEIQLKKCSAVAHQKLLKTAVEGFRTNVSEQPTQPMSSQKVSHQYVMMEGESSGMEQHMQPRDYLVQEEDYQVPHPGGFYQESMIQEAAKDVDNEL